MCVCVCVCVCIIKPYNFYPYITYDGRIILRWIFRKWDVGFWTELSWLRIGTVGGHL